MTEVAARELRNAAAQLIERAQGGERIVITNRGKPVAELVPVGVPAKRRWLPRAELAALLAAKQADPGLREELRLLGQMTTDDDLDAFT